MKPASAPKGRFKQNMFGIYVITKQEFVYNLFSMRMLILLFLLAFAVIGGTYGLSYLIVHGEQDTLSLNLRGSNDVMGGMSAFIAYIGSLMAIVFGFDSITREQTQGSLDMLLTRPITRRGIILGKFIGIWLSLTVPLTLVLTVGVGMVSYMVGLPDLGVTVALFILTILFIGTFISFQQIFSTLSRNIVEALITGIMLYLLYTMFWPLFSLGCGYILGVDISTNPATTEAAIQKDTLVDVYGLFNPNVAYQSAMSGMIDPSYVHGMHYLTPALALVLWFLVTLFINVEVFNRKIQESA
jgi:ABC-2 type transport system permease protein